MTQGAMQLKKNGFVVLRPHLGMRLSADTMEGIKICFEHHMEQPNVKDNRGHNRCSINNLELLKEDCWMNFLNDLMDRQLGVTEVIEKAGNCISMTLYTVGGDAVGPGATVSSATKTHIDYPGTEWGRVPGGIAVSIAVDRIGVGQAPLIVLDKYSVERTLFAEPGDIIIRDVNLVHRGSLPAPTMQRTRCLPCVALGTTTAMIDGNWKPQRFMSREQWRPLPVGTRAILEHCCYRPPAGERTYPMNPLGDEIGETGIADCNQGMPLLECIDAGYDPGEGARMHAEFMEGHGDDSDV